jgi:methyltransferase (TIGR00027 family)
MLFARGCVVGLLAAFAAGAVEPGLPSKTSVWVAAMRAIGAKNPDPEFRNPDYLAIKFLGSRERAILTDYPMDALDLDYDAALKRIPDPFNVTQHLARTKYVDTTVEESLRDGARQIVVLGAGFDSRGYRFRDRLRGARFFEVDYGPTQEYKKRRVKEVLGGLPKHVRYIAMDFTKDDLPAQLRKGGYSEKLKTLFVWEGVTMYIPEAAVKQTLRFVRGHSGPGSMIVFNYFLSRMPAINNPDSRYARWGEPMIFGFPGDGAADFVRNEGLEVISDLNQGEVPRKYARQTDGTASLPARLRPAAGGGDSFGGWCIARVPAAK